MIVFDWHVKGDYFHGQKVFEHTKNEGNLVCHLDDTANLLFWVLWTCLARPVKKDSINLWNHWCLPACKEASSCLNSFLKYRKNIVNFSGCFGMPDKSHQKKSINFHKTEVYQHANKSTVSPTSFLRYYKNIAQLLFTVTYACLVKSIKYHSINL